MLSADTPTFIKCFVTMPFGSHLRDPSERARLDHLYEEEIKPTVEGTVIPSSPIRFSCTRGDEEVRSDEILTQIVEHLCTADIVIADLTGSNANVFYELGIRHALGGRTILLARDVEDIPFNLRGFRTIRYAYTFEGFASFRRALRHSLITISSDSLAVENTVRRYILKASKTATETSSGSDVSLLLNEIRDLKQAMKTQVDEMKNLADSVTSTKDNIKAITGAPEGLSFLVGMWYSRGSKTNIYIRVIGNEIHAPYCHGGNSHSTARYHSFRLVGRTVFARFTWFSGDISGYAMYRIVSHNELTGGWWFDTDVPESVKLGIESTDALTGMTRETLYRAQGKTLPAWAEEYFRSVS